jgi:hypothetical protein
MAACPAYLEGINSHFMKHLFLSLAALCAVTFGGWAQCSADFDFGDTEFGISPNPAIGETFVDGTVNQPYTETIHVLIPASTAGIPDSPIELPLDSVVLDSILLIGEMGEQLSTLDVGLTLMPNNNGDSGNPNAFLGGGQYCANLEGTPDSAGVFTGAIYTTAWVTVPFLGANPIEFPFEGYSLTINPEPIPGCTDEIACNYDAEATEDDGSCTYAEPLYDCEGNCLNDADGDGICDEVGGCMDDSACNFDYQATEDDGSCEYAEDYYDCDGNCLMDTDGDGICDELEVAGCTDLTACNYDEAATDDDGSCTFADAYYDCDGNCLNDEDMDGVCDELEVAGCTSPYACNYVETATDDDGSCLVIGDACDDGNDMTENDVIDENCECMGEEIVDGVALFDLDLVQVFPNPATEVLQVTLPEGQSHTLTLFSVTGQRAVITQRTTAGQVALDVADLPAGAYLLHVQHHAGQVVRQIMLGGR